jgi:hypothetical protein
VSAAARVAGAARQRIAPGEMRAYGEQVAPDTLQRRVKRGFARSPGQDEKARPRAVRLERHRQRAADERNFRSMRARPQTRALGTRWRGPGPGARIPKAIGKSNGPSLSAISGCEIT